MTAPSNGLVMPEPHEGGVRIVFGTRSPFGSADVSFAGDGVLSFDPAAPDRLLSLDVTSPLDAPATLECVLGREQAEGVVAAWSGDRSYVGLVPQPSAGLAALARLALVLWLEEWSPLDAPNEAELVDVGVAAQAVNNPLLAIRSFSRSAPFLISAADRALTKDLPDAVWFGIGEALTAAESALGGAHPFSARIAELKGEFAGSRGIAAGEFDDRIRLLLEVDQFVGDGAETVDPELGELFSVDWALVPGHVLDPHEASGHMSRSGDGVRITVRPARYRDRSAGYGLSVRLLDPKTGGPVAVAPLLWQPSDELFTADFDFATWRDVDPEALASAVPEVFAEDSDGTVPVPRTRTARDAAGAWRSAVRALTAYRRSRASALGLGTVLPLEGDSARMSAKAAARVWAKLDGEGDRVEALRAWLDGGGTAGVAAWPTGLVVPSAVSVDRPTLTELIEVASPELFDVAQG